MNFESQEMLCGGAGGHGRPQKVCGGWVGKMGFRAGTLCYVVLKAFRFAFISNSMS